MKKLLRKLHDFFTDEDYVPMNEVVNAFCNKIQRDYSPMEQAEIIKMIRLNAITYFDSQDEILTQKVECVNVANVSLKNI